MQTFHHRRIHGDERPAGRTAYLSDDGHDFIYLVERKERADFKAWATAIFAGGMNCKKLTGAWPYYHVVQS